jgi:hypothetical protein
MRFDLGTPTWWRPAHITASRRARRRRGRRARARGTNAAVAARARLTR